MKRAVSYVRLDDAMNTVMVGNYGAIGKELPSPSKSTPIKMFLTETHLEVDLGGRIIAIFPSMVKMAIFAPETK